jgi:hypothetical protein
VTKIRYSTEIKNNIIKVEYFIDFFKQNKNLIIPSDLTLYYDYHILCYNKNIKTNIFITSLAIYMKISIIIVPNSLIRMII